MAPLGGDGLLCSFACLLLATTAQSLPPFKIVHLGDSYSSGNGARDEDGDLNFIGVPDCRRSPTSWGSQFAESLEDVYAVTYVNRACSGSLLKHLTEERHMDTTHEKLHCPSPTPGGDEVIRMTGSTAGIVTCDRVLRPQIDAIDDSVDLVLMTITGNDLGFGTAVWKCFVVVARSASGCRDAIKNGKGQLNHVEEELVAVFAQLRLRLKPTARVVLVAYPHLVLEGVEYSLDWLGWSAGAYDAAGAIRELATLLDDRQRSAVEQANAAASEDFVVFYDETKDLFRWHEPDPGAFSSNTDGWLHDFGSCLPVPLDCYHFNARGHQQLGAALSVLETFGATGGQFERGANIDMAFVIDTTGSMRDDIVDVRSNLHSLVDQLHAATSTYRVAVVSYRDHPERTGDSIDYPARVDQTFTNDLSAIQAAIDSLSANGGGDGPETVFSGIKAALDLSWRPGVTKIAIVMGDAPPLVVDGAEPISGLTSSQIVAESIALDPVETLAVNRGSLLAAPLESVVASTGGSSFENIGSVSATLSTVIEETSHQPYAWFGMSVVGKVGRPVELDASGSVDPLGRSIELYEWDFEADGAYDFTTEKARANFTFEHPFTGVIVLRVTSPGGTALASAPIAITEGGTEVQSFIEPCEVDEDGFSILISETGALLSCNATNLRFVEPQGLTIIYANNLTTTTNTTTTSSSTTSSTTTNTTTTLTTTSTSSSSVTSTRTATSTTTTTSASTTTTTATTSTTTETTSTTSTTTTTTSVSSTTATSTNTTTTTSTSSASSTTTISTRTVSTSVTATTVTSTHTAAATVTEPPVDASHSIKPYCLCIALAACLAVKAAL